MIHFKRSITYLFSQEIVKDSERISDLSKLHLCLANWVMFARMLSIEVNPHLIKPTDHINFLLGLGIGLYRGYSSSSDAWISNKEANMRLR